MSAGFDLLLIEDDEVDVQALQRAFRKAELPHRLHVVYDGHAALERLRAGDLPAIRAVLLDLNLPRMNGVEFLESLRKDDALRGLPVFVLTTSDAAADKAAAYRCGVSGYLVKSEMAEDFAGAARTLDAYLRQLVVPRE